MKLFYLTFIVTIFLVINLVIGENITEDQAIQALSQAEKDMSEMLDAGFTVVFVNDTLLEAKNDFKQKKYSLVIEKTQLISKRKSQAYNISDSLKALELGIKELDKLNINTSKIVDILNEGISTFKEERYEEVEELVEEAHTELTKARSEATIVQVRIRATKENIVSFIKDKWSNIVVGTIALAVGGYVVFNRITIMRTRNRIEDLEIEKEVIVNLMKKAQIEHFEKGTLTKESYEIKIRKYKERMLQIKELLPVLKSRISDKK